MPCESKCDICGDKAEHRCGGCHSIFYCNKEHQVAGWKTHKKNCKPFKIEHDPVLGRHLVATRNIKSGEVLLKEAPLVRGPPQITPPVCLGCGKLIDEKNSKPCSKCGWPVCGKECENSDNHIPECYYTVRRGKKVTIKDFNMPHPNYQCITVLRCLYQQQYEPNVWQKIIQLSSHCEERRKTDKYLQDKTTVSGFIRKFFSLEEVFQEDEILKICGILMINGHEVPLSEPPHIAIYEQTSMLEHNCSPNCSKTFTEQGEALVISGTPIKKGENLTISYTDFLWGTPNRRHHLFMTKFFWCSCQRCADPTEFGTHYSCLKCQNSSCKGFLKPDTFLTAEKPPEKWTCSSGCGDEMESEKVEKLLEKVGKDIHAMEKGSSGACKKFLKHYSKILPENHFYMVDIKLALLQMIGLNGRSGQIDFAEEDIALKANMCRELVDLISILAPGEKRLKGTLLFEQHAAVAEIGQRRVAAQSMELPEYYSNLLQARSLLEQSMEMLQHEPTAIQEGRIYQQSKINIRSLEQILSSQ